MFFGIINAIHYRNVYSSISILNYPTTKNYLFITISKLLIIFQINFEKLVNCCFYVGFKTFFTIFRYITNCVLLRKVQTIVRNNTNFLFCQPIYKNKFGEPFSDEMRIFLKENNFSSFIWKNNLTLYGISIKRK